MVSSARQVIACVLFIFIATVSSSSQTTPEKGATGSITGKVTLKNKALAGIVIVAREANSSGRDRSRYRDTTDETGNYRITNLPAGTYVVVPVAMSLVVENEQTSNAVLSEGDTLENVNFSLVRGGVITGRITDLDGRPVIEEYVSVWPVEGTLPSFRLYGMGPAQTDDRGVYRAFGLRPGKYRVAVGSTEGQIPRRRAFYRQTFYPSVNDIAKSTLIEVTEGSEANNIDIVLGRALTGFKVTGRIVDGETGKPLPNLMYGLSRRSEYGGETMTSGAVSNANGEFRFENLLPGKYSVFISAGETNIRADWVSFEVFDRDVADLLLKTTKAASVSGVVVFEGAEGTPQNPARGLYVSASLDNPDLSFHEGYSASVKPDGSFKLTGLPGGIVGFELFVPDGRAGSGRPGVVRIERDGIVQPLGIQVKDREDVTGVRLVVRYFSGAIRGQVKFEEPGMSTTAQTSVSIRLVDADRSNPRMRGHAFGAQVDSRGRFVVEGLAAGTYEITVWAAYRGNMNSLRTAKEQVTVNDNTVTEVTLTLKPEP